MAAERKGRFRYGLVGAGNRAEFCYAPALQILADRVEWVGITARTPHRAAVLAARYGVPHYASVAELVREGQPDAVIVAVSSAANGAVARQVAGLGCHMVVETPIAVDLAEARALLGTARARGLQICETELHLREPEHRLGLALVRAGAFGTILGVAAHYTHGYHGISLLRCYAGANARARRVTGWQQTFAVVPYVPLPTFGFDATSLSLQPVRTGPPGLVAEPQETWQHAVIEFEGGPLGYFDWISTGYFSPARPVRSLRFWGTRGMGEVSIVLGEAPRFAFFQLEADGRTARRIPVETRTVLLDGVEVLDRIIAHTDPPVSWVNPYRAARLPVRRGLLSFVADDPIVHVSTLDNFAQTVRGTASNEYDGEQAYHDQEICVALARSAAAGNSPVELPLPVDGAP
jgi:predicted dehydrogenase